MCKNENKFAETMLNPMKNKFDIISFISVRRDDKQRILKQFEDAFSTPEYLYSQEFPYLFLLFSIIFCKSVSKTAQIIQDKFRVSDKTKGQTQNQCSESERKEHRRLCGNRNPRSQIWRHLLVELRLQKEVQSSEGKCAHCATKSLQFLRWCIPETNAHRFDDLK